MKRTLFVLSLAVVLVVAFSTSAYALHKGYDATSGNCRSCHAVHNATGDHLYNSTLSAGAAAPSVYATVPGKVALTSSSIAQDLCEWCHVYGTTDAVYQAGMTVADAGAGKFVLAMHEIGSPATAAPDAGTSHQDLDLNAIGLDCIDCHNALPHAAGRNTNVAWYVKDAGATAAEVTNNMCIRCHEGNDAAAHAGTTHPLVETPSTDFATSNYGPQQVAFVGSPDCLSCHDVAGGVHSVVAPVVTNGAIKPGDPLAVPPVPDTYANTITPANNVGWKFTSAGIAGARSYTYVDPASQAIIVAAGGRYAPKLSGAQKVADLQCGACHTNSGATAGVGITY